MNVREFKAWLDQFPDDAEVLTIHVASGGQYTQGGEPQEVPFDVGTKFYPEQEATAAGLGSTFDYTDIKPGNKYFPDGLKTLLIGSFE